MCWGRGGKRWALQKTRQCRPLTVFSVARPNFPLRTRLALPPAAAMARTQVGITGTHRAASTRTACRHRRWQGTSRHRRGHVRGKPLANAATPERASLLERQGARIEPPRWVRPSGVGHVLCHLPWRLGLVLCHLPWRRPSCCDSVVGAGDLCFKGSLPNA